MLDRATGALHDVVRAAKLEDIGYDRLAAERNLGEGEMDAPGVPQFRISIRHATDEGQSPRLRVSLGCTISLAVGRIDVEPFAEYSFSEDVAIHLADEALVLDFVNEIAVMALLPYVRHALSDLSLRVFDGTILMPVMPRGAIRFGALAAEGTSSPAEA